MLTVLNRSVLLMKLIGFFMLLVLDIRSRRLKFRIPIFAMSSFLAGVWAEQSKMKWFIVLGVDMLLLATWQAWHELELTFLILWRNWLRGI